MSLEALEDAMGQLHIRPLDARAPAEIELVARRMRATLVEVLGEARGGDMYSQDWLVARVRWHLAHGAVFVAEDGAILGHTIVRVEEGEGLFSTTYVEPAARRRAIASTLLEVGEAWMRARGLGVAVTYTDAHNTKLQRLFLGRGYRLTPMENAFVRLSRTL